MSGSPDTLGFDAWIVRGGAHAGFWCWQAHGMREVWGPLDEMFMWAEAKRLAAKLGFEKIEINKLPVPPKWWTVQRIKSRSKADGLQATR